MSIKKILQLDDFSREDIITLLSCQGEERSLLFNKSAEIKEKYIGKKGLVQGTDRVFKYLQQGLPLLRNKKRQQEPETIQSY